VRQLELQVELRLIIFNLKFRRSRSLKIRASTGTPRSLIAFKLPPTSLDRNPIVLVFRRYQLEVARKTTTGTCTTKFQVCSVTVKTCHNSLKSNVTADCNYRYNESHSNQPHRRCTAEGTRDQIRQPCWNSSSSRNTLARLTDTYTVGP
jgi:hypothetical protein